MSNIAIITGISGQDGFYLSNFLLNKKYVVYGLSRQCVNINEHIKIFCGDVLSPNFFSQCLEEILTQHIKINIIEIYNLAAQTNVSLSFKEPENTLLVNTLPLIYILKTIREKNIQSITKIFQASTSEIFGNSEQVPQDENTAFNPNSPYGLSKLNAHLIIKYYREMYGFFACNGILYNHESKLRSDNFVTKKIVLGIKMIMNNENEKLKLGNIDSIRDWGHAKDYVEGMWLMLQNNKPSDYVLSSGIKYTVRHFIEVAFGLKNINIKWKGKDLNEIGYDEKSGNELIFIDSDLFRPFDNKISVGNSHKIKKELNWCPKISFVDMIKDMFDDKIAF